MSGSGCLGSRRTMRCGTKTSGNWCLTMAALLQYYSSPMDCGPLLTAVYQAANTHPALDNVVHIGLPAVSSRRRPPDTFDRAPGHFPCWAPGCACLDWLGTPYARQAGSRTALDAARRRPAGPARPLGTWRFGVKGGLVGRSSLSVRPEMPTVAGARGPSINQIYPKAHWPAFCRPCPHLHHLGPCLI